MGTLRWGNAEAVGGKVEKKKGSKVTLQAAGELVQVVDVGAYLPKESQASSTVRTM